MEVKPERREQLLENMRRRHEKLKRERVSRVDEEGIDEFQKQFNKLDQEQKLECAKAVPDFKVHNEIVKEMRKLIEKFSDCLSPYDVRVSYDRIEKATEDLLKVKERLKSKKKFTFGASARQKSGASSPKKPAASTSLSHSKFSVKEHPKEEIVEELAAQPTDSENTREISNKKGEIIHISRDDGEIEHLLIAELTGCTVYSYGEISAAKFTNLKNCAIFLENVRSSAYISDCSDCSFFLRLHQLRAHNSLRCNMFLHISSNPIIEDCSELRFAPFMGIEGNKWNVVSDFNWLRPTKSPNWDVLEERAANDSLSEIDHRIGKKREKSIGEK